MRSCKLCPRACGANRTEGIKGRCGVGAQPALARAAAHFGEEPCISGSHGSGAVFFSGCSLHCVYCQNKAISGGGIGKAVSVHRLAEIFSELEDSGVHNLNLVTATQFAGDVVAALKIARPKIPVIWNCSGYESPETLQMLEGHISIYMPDLKYSLPERAARYSGAPDYPRIARMAIDLMYNQLGPFVMDDSGILKSGVLIRHLILPGGLEDTLDVIDWVSGSFAKGSVLFSLMSQYTPLAEHDKYPELSRRISVNECERAHEYLRLSGIEAGYTQELSSATDELIPDFDLSGV